MGIKNRLCFVLEEGKRSERVYPSWLHVLADLGGYGVYFSVISCSALLCVGYFDFWTFVLWRKGWHSWLIFVHKTPTTTNNNRGVGEPGRFFTTLFFTFYSPHLLRYTLSLAFLEIHLVPLKETKDYGKRCSSSSLLLVHTTFFQPSNFFCRLAFFTYCLFWTYGVD